jgi:hypothetical protein
MKKVVFTTLVALAVWQLSAQDALETVRLLSSEARYAASTELLTTYIQNNPQRKYDIGRAWLLQSQNLLQMEQLAAAREANGKSINLRMQLRSGDIAENFLQETKISLAAGKPTDALVAAQQGMEMLIEDPLLYAQLNLYAAKALTTMGRFAEANRYYQTATEVLAIEVGEQDPDFGQLLFEGGRLFDDQRAYRAAFQQFARAYYTLRDPVARTKALYWAWRSFQLAMK